jgi:putative surface-exposed virulence protein
MHTRRLSTLAGFLILTLVMVAAMLLTTPVFAQDEVPPAPEETPAEVAPVEESAPVEEAPVEEPAPLEEAPAQEPAPEIVPLDENGEALSLATQEAAEALAEPDPWFACTDDSVDGTPDGKCIGYGTLALALAAYNMRVGSGPIYLEAGTHTVTANITITTAAYPSLTGIMADAGLTSADVNLHFNDGFYLSVTNTTAGFTLKGMNIDGNYSGALLDFDANTGALNLTDLIVQNIHNTGDAIDITNQTGNVTLHTVEADLNGDQGAHIVSTGNVSVTNSSFDHNSNSGAGTATHSLHIVANGSITLTGISSSQFFNGDGAMLESQKSITVKNSVFNNNWDTTVNNGRGYGLYIAPTSVGSILLDHVYANFNYEETGIYLHNHGGAVTMNTVEANGNRTGIDIDNCWDLGSGCTAPSTAVTLTNLTVDGNNYGGLSVKSNGNISVSNIFQYGANNAAAVFEGIRLDNNPATAAKTVTLTNAVANNDYLGGIIITTRGTVTLNHVEASSSGGGDGIRITPGGSAVVNILGTLGSNVTNYNAGYGVYIVSKGLVSVNTLQSYGNTLTNLYIDNSGGTGAVTVNSGSFGASVAGSGIVIQSKGAITLTAVDGYSNAVDGINLSNETAPSSQPVTIKNTSSDVNNDMGYNSGVGLVITSRGNVSVTGIYSYNDWGGLKNSRIFIDNRFGTGTVSLTSTTIYYANDPSVGFPAAVSIFSNGAVTVSSFNGFYNFDRGLYIDNSSSTGSPGVTIKDLIVENNDLAGLDILTKGAVKLTNTDANSMDGGEAAVKIVTTGSVSMDAPAGNSNSIQYNAVNGLLINASGSVSLKRVSSSDNSGGHGAWIYNCTTASIADSNFYSNGSYGLDVECSGAITLTNTNASSNGSSGAILNNSSGSAGVTVSGNTSYYAYFQDNPNQNLSISTTGALKLNYLYISGSPLAINLPLAVGDVAINTLYIQIPSGVNPALDLVSTGTITVTHLESRSISASGVQLDNSGAGSAKAVTITDFYDTSSIGSYALRVLSRGTITLTNYYVTGGNVRTNGIYLDNTASTVKSAVTIKTPGAARNYNYAANFPGLAMEVHSHGQVTLDDMQHQNNTGTGLKVNDLLDTNMGGVTVTNSLINSNTNGANITAGGAIVLSNMQVSSNNGMGAVLDNSSAAVASSVTITTLDADNNDTGGLTIYSRGAVTITNLDADSQDVSGYALYVATDGSVTLGHTGSAWNDLNSNTDGSSVYINAGGNVTIKGLYADTNTGAGNYGANITAGGAVTITDANFYNNPHHGLNILAGGAITLTNVDVYQSGSTYSAILDNHAGSGGITITGNSSDWCDFYGSTSTNLTLNTSGDVKLSYISAYNGVRGIDFPSTVGNVTMSHVLLDSITGAYYGIQLTSTGTVSLSYIDADNTPGGGIWIDNSAASSSKNVTLVDIDARDNSGEYGIYVLSKGAISVKDLNVNGYDVRQYGVWLDNTPSTTKAGVTMSSSPGSNNYINDTINNGLRIYSNGSVSVSNIIINDTSDGIIINNTYLGAGTGSVTLNTVDVDNSENDGINIATNGIVTLTNVFSDSNGTDGTGNGISVMVGETASHYSGTVTLTNINTSYNHGDGLHVEALKQITLKDHYAYMNYNSGRGAYLASDGGVSVLSPGGTDWNIFDENDGSNLVIDTLGAVVLQKMEADDSVNGYGIQVVHAGSVTLTSIYATSNPLIGVDVTSTGAITVIGLKTNNNSQSGAELDNHLGSGGVTVKSSHLDINFGAGPFGGLIISTNGAVLLDTVSVDDNGGLGADILVNNPSTAAVTVNKSTFNDNNGDGLHVTNQGSITINGVSASNNHGGGSNGAYLDNHIGSGNVNVLGINNFSFNNLHGLGIFSKGSVTIGNVTAENNYNGVGIGVDNATWGGTGAVTITTALARGNHLSGIAIDTNGAVTLTGIQALFNGTSSDMNGINLSTVNKNVLVQNSVISGNGKNGIYASLGSGILTVKKTYYMGNNTDDPYTIDENIHMSSGTLVIIP